MALHQVGAPVQQPVIAQVWITNRTGVIAQCTAHKPLANVPIKSDFDRTSSILANTNETELQTYDYTTQMQHGCINKILKAFVG